jgi:hypothetical protein
VLPVLLPALQVTISPPIYKFYSNICSVLNVCPKSDLSIVGIADKVASAQNLIARSADNCSVLDNGTAACVSAFNFPYYGEKAFNPLKLGPDEPGSEPLSNLPGNAFTDFGVPAYTLKLFPGYSSVITPASFNSKAAAATQTINPTAAGTTAGSGGATTTGKTTGSAASSTSSTKPNSASISNPNTWWGIVILAVMVGMF